ncbi:N-acetylmuramoyl-L-alanine amidase [Jeotgalibaca porci]|uniref:SH3 domain-containing protein n=1 Tax=Jeotgalibaca porci TaxID=1868793 RepID=A0A6G7WEK1_9LACT|nr:N-acetylmuramoyl-L-alanine amidase [Jeotgalibaca porci]QIK50661.1 SH3 domain-containing protein [Jeotgalibaca porci]
MKPLRISRNVMLALLVIFFMGLGSLGTVALANYTNIIVEASTVNVRLGPGLGYDILTQVQGGSMVNVLDEENEWYKVRLDDGRIGWVASWLINNTEVAASQNLVATINEYSVNLRAENNEQAEVIGSAEAGEVFTLLYEENGWSQIHYNNQTAWVLSELVTITAGTLPNENTTDTTEQVATPTSQDSVVVLQDNVNVRSGPTLQDGVIEVANAGAVYAFQNNIGDFVEVLTNNGETGYIANWLVESSVATTTQTRVPAITTTLSEATIVIDPGHGGADPGAIGDYMYEKQATVDTAAIIAQKLESVGANVILTRTGDESISLEERAYLSNSYGADLFISIHYDSTPEGVYATGTTTYYYADSDNYVADLINDELSKNLPLPNNGSRFGNFLVLRENAQPAILLELGYMNNPDDVATFNTSHYQNLVADSILNALTDYFNN